MLVRTALWLSVVLGLGLGLATPVLAQEQVPIPFTYPENAGVLPLSDNDKPADQRAAEEAAANAAELACTTGDLAGCAALGRAFLYGEGRPQNRPVAELLLRQACDGAEAAGCLGLGVLMRSLREPAPNAVGTMALGRGCRLGNLEACSAEADAIEEGTAGPDGDSAAAMALRREACSKGGTSACRALGSRLARSEDPAAHGEGIRLLERQCRAGDGEACALAIPPLREEIPPRTALEREMLEAGCTAGVAYLCSELGNMVFAEGSGPPEGRTAALALFDRACALASLFCALPEQVRARPALAASCEGGVQADCVTLGQIYGRNPSSPLHSPLEAERLLGVACETGRADACGAAAQVLAEARGTQTAQDLDRITRWYDAGCAGGINQDCETLGKFLLGGEALPPDRQRGYALLALTCERGDGDSCKAFEDYARDDPEAPLLAADSRYSPPLTAEEEAEQARQEAEERERERQERRERYCRVSEVAFRGAVYADAICATVARVVRGFRVKPGDAPWQALLWRPAQMNGRTLTDNERVECGGALIREGWILTAAHCVIDARRRPLLTAGHQFRLGVVDASEPDGISYSIRRVFAHPNYHEASRTFDIALVELDTRRWRRVGTPHVVKSIPIAGTTTSQRVPRAGAPVYVFGWGQTAFQGRTSTQLKAAKLALEDPAQCESRNRLRGFLQGSILCAKATDGSQACDGDSGGPLVSYEGRPTVIGVVSAGTECGRTGVATRYTRVAKVQAWIDEVLAGRAASVSQR